MTCTWTPESEQPKPHPGVDYHTVKAWFQQCRDMAAAIEAQKQKIQRIREVAEKTTPSLSGMPGGNGGGDKIGYAVERLDAEQKNLQKMEEELISIKVAAASRAYCLTSTKQAEFLCMFYIDGKSLTRIANEKQIGNSTTVFESIKQGCIYLAEMYGTQGDWTIKQIRQNKR